MPQKRKTFSHGIKLAAGPQKKAKSSLVKTKAEGSSKVASSVRKEPSSTRSTPFHGFARPAPSDVTALHRHLARIFGERRPSASEKREIILDTVAGTILSQNTTNTNSHAAMCNLKDRFKNWDAVRLAKPADVAAAIRVGGLAPTKTRWIQDILKTIHKERGRTCMEYLRGLSKDEVHKELTRFTGVGAKTAAIINLFRVGHPDMAVDTHVFRYAVQMNWVPSEEERATHNASVASAKERWPVVTRDTAYQHLDAIFPDRVKYSMHLILTDTEGGLPTVCTARDNLSWDGRAASVNGKPVRDVVREAAVKK